MRRDQDLADEAETLDKAIVVAVSKERVRRDAADEQRSRDRLAVISTERANLQKTFAGEFPNYAVLSNPLPLKAAEMQALLSNNEAMVLFAVAPQCLPGVLGAVCADRGGRCALIFFDCASQQFVAE